MGQYESKPLRDVRLTDKYALDTTRAYMTGIEALVRLPILQHQRDQQRGLNTAGFVSGYRGSPGQRRPGPVERGALPESTQCALPARG